MSDDKEKKQQNDQAGHGFAEEDVELIFDFITESKEHLETAENAMLTLENEPEDEEALNLIFRGFHTIKGMAGFMNLTEIGEVAHAAETLLDAARKGQTVLRGSKSDVVFASIDMIKTLSANLENALNTGSAIAEESGVKTLLEQLTKENQSCDDIDAESQAPDKSNNDNESAIQAEAESSQAKEPAQQQNNSSGQANKARVADEKVKVSTKRLDNLINMAGELVISQLMVSESVKNSGAGVELASTVERQAKIVRELQELSMSMRMVPIQGVFQRMARLVRDLSQKNGKKIEFSTTGEETELDRTVVDNVVDPLVHMIRNSVDHGIESEADRIAAGKSPHGHIRLKAFHKAGSIVIQIEDDGKGLDREKILKKAIATGVTTPDQKLSDEQIYQLIFSAGFSTADKVTEVSGRGVGMDVVKKNIESLRGKVEIASTPGKGTVFTISLPLTLAIIDGQVIKVGNQRYVIPINSIVKSLRPEAEHISTIQNRGEMVMVRGRLLPLVRLYSLFEVEPINTAPSEALVVIVQHRNQQCCLMVDELLAQQQVVIKSLKGGLGKIKGISGGCIMGDGAVSLILDIPGMIELAREVAVEKRA